MKTDAQLQQDVLTELNWEPSVNAERITVQVSDGAVALSGFVNSYIEKHHAERIVQNVSGVRTLVIGLGVELAALSRRDDHDIARSARNALEWTTYVPKNAVRVVVHDGRVTLAGQLDWDWQRQGAISAIRHLTGVTDVSDRILIKFRPASSALQGDIESALKRRAIADVHNIQVSVRGTSVTLSGTAHSWSERGLAENCAWSTPGVRSVADHIAVA